MGKIFTKAAELKPHLSLISTADTNALTSASDLDAAFRDFVIPVLGDDLANDLVDAYQASIATSPTVMTDPLKSLLPIVRDVVAPMGWLKYLAKNYNTSKDGGITIQVDADSGRASSPLWAYNKLAKQLSEDGMRSVDALYTYLDKLPSGTFPQWESSDAYTQYKDGFIQTTVDFNKQYFINNNRYTFLRLKSFMNDVEDLMMEGAIGKDFYTYLKSKLSDRTFTFNNHEKEFLRLFKKAIAFHTISFAAESLPLVFENGLMALPEIPREEYGAEIGLKAMDSDRVKKIKSEAERIGNIWLGKALNYLNATASSSIFQVYFNSPTYTSNNNSDQLEQNKKGSGFGMFL